MRCQYFEKHELTAKKSEPIWTIVIASSKYVFLVYASTDRTASPLYKNLLVITGNAPMPIFVENITCTKALNHKELFENNLSLNGHISGKNLLSIAVATCHPVTNARQPNPTNPNKYKALRFTFPLCELFIKKILFFMILSKTSKIT